MTNYRTPGVYVEEISSFPPSVAQVETAIPAFIGYTETGPTEPTRISSMIDYRAIFGGPNNEIETFSIDGDGNITGASSIPRTPKYRLYYMLEMFFANGGGDCFIISVGDYTDSITKAKMTSGLELLAKEDVPTLILFPDAESSKNSGDAFDMYNAALEQCKERKDRFLICDVPHSEATINTIEASAEEFRNAVTGDGLMFGAAYFPNLKTTMSYQYSESDIKVNIKGDEITLRLSDADIENGANEETSLFHADEGAYRNKYHAIRKMIGDVRLELPPSAAMAGVYARVDSSRGVWKAPANVSLNRVSAPKLKISDRDQAGLNDTSTGKTINAIRSFKGKGVMVWGARTMDSNDLEWRYISVRRFFNMVEESVKNASERFVFEPNDANTWVKVKAMVENYLTTLWRSGAMMGGKPEDAFFVRVGLGETMSLEDVTNGRMIVEIGMAVVRPAEFIILRFSHKMMES